MKRERFLFLVAAVCGGGALALELTASRLLAPVFGTSMIVWSAIIGSTLVDLTAGYWFGGWLADRRPEEGLLYRLMTVAAVLTGIIPFLAHPILQWGWRATNRLAVGGVVGAFFVLLLLFALPVALLGAVSPFVLRLVIPAVTSAGRTAGKLSAVATLGSLVGALLPALVLVPLFGTRHTFLVVALVVIALAVWGFLRLSRQKAAALSATLGLLLALGYLPLRHIPIIAYEKAIYETESVYNYIQVVERGRGSGKGVFLRLNESKNDHSVYRPNRTFTYQVWDYAAITPMLTPDFDPVEHPISRVALIGGAAGTMARILTRVYGPVPIDHVEIDPKVIEVARKYFGLTEKNIHVHNEDGRAFLARSHERYDVVLVDAYQIPYIPFHLTTTEFFRIVREHLSPRGAVMVNTLRIRESPELFRAICKTMEQNFGSVYVLELFARGHGQRGSDMGNTLLFATARPTGVEDLRANVERIEQSAWFQRFNRLEQAGLRRAMRLAKTRMRPFEGEGRILTDDDAPVEWLVHESILRLIWHTVTGKTEV